MTTEITLLIISTIVTTILLAFFIIRPQNDKIVTQKIAKNIHQQLLWDLKGLHFFRKLTTQIERFISNGDLKKMRRHQNRLAKSIYKHRFNAYFIKMNEVFLSGQLERTKLLKLPFHEYKSIIEKEFNEILLDTKADLRAEVDNILKQVGLQNSAQLKNELLYNFTSDIFNTARVTILKKEKAFETVQSLFYHFKDQPKLIIDEFSRHGDEKIHNTIIKQAEKIHQQENSGTDKESLNKWIEDIKKYSQRAIKPLA